MPQSAPPNRQGAPVPAQLCPLCAQPNACAMAAGSTAPCWCTRVEIPASLLDRLAPAERGTACICAQCVKTASA
ncbi:MAG TPA: cysteine-rich CWC family protein [Burkholderiaceae bacterium]|nr:cysteine-rich CWC family protein [Burkholderiaceae bacterium]